MENIFKHRYLLEKVVTIASASLLFLLGLTLFAGVSAGDIQFWDEATNLQVIVESSREQDFWNLRYQGQYFWEKPPLFYWVGIGIYKLAGSNPELLPYLVRGFTAFCSFALIALVYIVLRRRSVASGLIWLVIISAVPFFWQFSPSGVLATHNFRSADSDIMQILFMLFSFLAVHKFKQVSSDPKRSMASRWRWVLAAGFFSGLAVFTKGPLGLLPLALLLFPTKGYQLHALLILGSIVAALSVTLLWIALMLGSFGEEFWHEYFIYHQLSRTSSILEGHDHPWWFYLRQLVDPGFAGMLVPGIFSAVILILQKSRTWLLASSALIMTLILFLAVQLAATKIAWYLLPALVFACIFISCQLGNLIEILRIKIITPTLFLIYFFGVVSITCTLILFILQANTLQGSVGSEFVQYYCTGDSHRIFNFYQQAGVLDKYLPADITISKGDTLYVDLNQLSSCDLSSMDWELQRLVSGNYAILKLK